MATTTPNYGWDVPTSTDYVKDGALAIETLGDDIDATVITLGQGVKRYTVNTTATLTLTTTTETSLFTAASFTPVAGRLYELTYVIGSITKTTAAGNLIVRLRKDTTAGTAISSGLIAAPTVSIGASFSKTIVAELGSTAFVPLVSVQASTNGLIAANTTFDGCIIIKDLGLA